jgi:hypothetical protein
MGITGTYPKGKPARATRSFSLYNVRYGTSARPMSVYFADGVCDDSCRNTPYFELIDQQQCRKEVEFGTAPLGLAPSSRPIRVLDGLVRIGADVYVITADENAPEISLARLPRDVKPERLSGEWFRCWIKGTSKR